MRLLCFAKSRGQAASTRQRAFGAMDVAKTLGWKTRFLFAPAYPRWNYLPQRLVRFVLHWNALRSAGPDTVVLLQRTLRCPEFLWLLKRYRPRIGCMVLDIDDAVWLDAPDDVRTLTALCDEVWCGSRTAMDHFADTGKALFVPTTVDTGRFGGERREQDPPVIGWIGEIHAHRDNLAHFARVLSGIHASLPPFRLRLIGIRDFAPELKTLFAFLGDRLELVPWVEPADVGRELAGFSIGVMPLVANTFNAGKSALKLVEYLAAGACVVASDIGENTYVVRQPEHGYVATADAEWEHALRTLLSDPGLRAAMGERGRAFATRGYNRLAVYGRLFDALEKRLTPASPAGSRPSAG